MSGRIDEDTPPSTSQEMTEAMATANIDTEQSSSAPNALEIFGNKNNKKQKKTSKTPATQADELETLHSRKPHKRARSPDEHENNLFNAFRRETDKKKKIDNETIDALVMGDTPFTGSGDISEAMEQIAKAKKDDWAKLSTREILDWCYSLQSVLIQNNMPEASNNAAAIASMAQYFTLLAAECPAMEKMTQEAMRDAVKIARRDGQTRQGPPTLWIPIVKHLLHHVGCLTAEVDLLKKRLLPAPSAASNESRYRRVNSATYKESKTERCCRNCFEGTMKKVNHSTKDCEAMGNQCRMICTYCADGSKHWYSQCPTWHLKR